MFVNTFNMNILVLNFTAQNYTLWTCLFSSLFFFPSCVTICLKFSQLLIFFYVEQNGGSISFPRESFVNLTLLIGLDQFGISGGLIPLHNACSFGHAEVVRLLLRHGADPNSRDNWNYTPLHEAAVKGKVDVCVGQ